ncbi:tyrosine aminotransferase-like [Gigantopelta aegis]|uniref:tyrosine aminotransferase-like n=1 Tax=Gigantopelta aegis TaxID=1735272 RepID=UPI001B8890F9|nr:tyrosine aminotransferase-like [Gigantopelta aegis]
MEPKTKKGKASWDISLSMTANNTFNPIRNIVDGMKLTPNPDKDMIALSIGDPTVFGNLPNCVVAEDAIIEAVHSRKWNGYAPSIGYEVSREAVAKYVSTPNATVEAKDIILCNGCSGSLEMCITCLASPGQNILIPRPGFSIYKTLAESVGIETKPYDLLPSRKWEVDLATLENLIDANTVAIVVTNPSNPCGSVYSRQHLTHILAIASTHKIPIIADEIYEHFVFPGLQYHSLASLTDDVPILSCGGLTKRFLVPGWRLGWIVIYDKHGVFSRVRNGLVSLSQRILGPNSLVQSALPKILENTPQDFFNDTLEYIQKNAAVFYESLSRVQGLFPVMPQGAMYMMVGYEKERFPDIKDDVDFTEKLVKEQSVFCLPSKCFQYANFFRIVLTVPSDKVVEACERIKEFCSSHYVAMEMANGVHGDSCH